MSASLIFATLSAISLSTMVVLDSVMMRGCYSGKPRLAYNVAAVGGAFFGFILTVVIAVTEMDHFWSSSLSRFASSEMFLMLLSGFLTIFSMRYYFELFVPRAGERVNETAVSMWLSTIPIFVLLASAVPGLLGTGSSFFSVENFLIFLLVFLTGASFVKFESQDENVTLLRSNASKITKMLIISVAYLLLNEAVLDGLSRAEILTLQPYYWFGFLLGAFGLLFPAERKVFIQGLPRIQKYFIAILFMELLGSLVYLFEVWSFEELGALEVSLVVASHILLVFVITFLLSTWRTKLAGRDAMIVIPGMIMDFNELPVLKISKTKIAWLIMSLVFLVTTLIYLS